jgi:hypothetical protein
MQILPIKIRKNGFDYTQVLRESRKAVYRQYVTPEIEYFEVFSIQIRPDITFKGKLVPGGESYPGNEKFGKTAWTFRSLGKAIIKFNSLP